LKLSYRRMNVLLVDPVATALDTIDSVLEAFRFYRVWRARSVEEAMGFLRDKRVHLVICAAKQQPQSGFYLLEQIRADAQMRDLPVLLTLDRRDKQSEELAMKSGAAGVVPLPLEATTLRQAVEQALFPLIDHKEEEYLQQIGMARQAMRLGDLDGAEKSYRKALAAKSDEDAQVSLGKLLQAKGDLAGAEEVFVGAMKSHSSSLRAFLGLAEVYQTSGRLEDALKVLAGAVNAAKKLKASGEVSASIYFYMGELQLELKRLQEALGLFDLASQANPNNPRLTAKIGDALSKAGFMEEAVDFYQRALELDPELAHVYNRLGMAYRRQGKCDLALNLYQKALTFHPDDENLLYNMARCFWDMEEYQCAAEQLTKSLKLRPTFPEALKLLEGVLARMGFESEKPEH
jgi:tetratricopeptide (TPR) repeat protein